MQAETLLLLTVAFSPRHPAAQALLPSLSCPPLAPAIDASVAAAAVNGTAPDTADNVAGGVAPLEATDVGGGEDVVVGVEAAGLPLFRLAAVAASSPRLLPSREGSVRLRPGPVRATVELKHKTENTGGGEDKGRVYGERIR